MHMFSAKRGFARKDKNEDGSWLLTVGLTGEEDVTKNFEGTAEEADNELLKMFNENFGE